MTLLVCIFAAIITTVIWYKKLPDKKMMLGFLSLMYWGAALMWTVDAVFEYIKLKAAFFTPSAGDMLNDLYLGLCVSALGLVIWLAVLLIKDPKGVMKKAIGGKNDA